MLIPSNNSAAFFPSLCQGKGTKLKLFWFAAASPCIPWPWSGRNPALPFGRKGERKGCGLGEGEDKEVPGQSPDPGTVPASPGFRLIPAVSQHQPVTGAAPHVRLEPEMLLTGTSQRGGRLERSPPRALPPTLSLSAVLCGGQRGCATDCRHSLARALAVGPICLFHKG